MTSKTTPNDANGIADSGETPSATFAPPELEERALMVELATEMALAAGYAPHCWPTWEREATVIIPTINRHVAAAISKATRDNMGGV